MWTLSPPARVVRMLRACPQYSELPDCNQKRTYQTSTRPVVRRRPAACLGLNTYLNASDFNRVARAFWMNFSRLIYVRSHETCGPFCIATNVTILCAGLDCCFVRKAEVMPLCTTVALMPDGKCHAVHHSTSPGIRHGKPSAQFLGHPVRLILAELLQPHDRPQHDGH
jgi:hypothetical protein